MVALIISIYIRVTMGFSASPQSAGVEERWKHSRPWSERRQNDPHHRGWYWRKKMHKLKTTPKSTQSPLPTTPLPPGSEICRNLRIVTRLQDELGPVVCLRKNATGLMAQLRTVGGLIKRYAAANIIDACGFEDLTTITVARANTTTPPTATNSRNRSGVQFDAALGRRRKRTIPTSPGTRLRGCQGRGTIIDNTSEHRLCTECAATTRLPDGRFPFLINEVVCRDSDFQCAAKMGRCFQRSLELPFLRSTGMFEFDASLSAMTGKTVYIEVWEEYTQEIRSCCECGMYSPIYKKIATGDLDDD